MDLKPTLTIMGIIAVIAFAFGRYSVKFPPDTKTAETKAETDNKTTDTDTHKVTVIEKDCKTGVEKTTITEDSISREKEAQKTVDKLLTEVTQQKRRTTNISALAGLEDFKPAYGISANMEVFGPVTAGVFGMTNGTIGISLGINF